jgi:putative component of toxin-antitoxin plasmid stabilization module
MGIVSNFRTQYKSVQNLRTLQGYMFRIYISQPNFAILLILVCSF